MDVGHESVKMGAPLRRGFRRIEEQVHQHRLAAPDLAMDIEAARRLGRLRAEKAGKAPRLSFRAIAPEPCAERVKLLGEFGLRGVESIMVFGDESPIPPRDRGHGDGASGKRAHSAGVTIAVSSPLRTPLT